MQEDTRKMVSIMVEMERNYITAEYFRTIQVGAGCGWGLGGVWWLMG